MRDYDKWSTRNRDNLGEEEMPGVIPKLSKTPGAIRHRAPTLGEHTQATLLEHGFSEEQIQILKDQGILG